MRVRLRKILADLESLDGYLLVPLSPAGDREPRDAPERDSRGENVLVRGVCVLAVAVFLPPGTRAVQPVEEQENGGCEHVED